MIRVRPSREKATALTALALGTGQIPFWLIVGAWAFVALRVAGDDGFEWTIEPFQTGVAHFEGLPALPEGVAESVGLRERSVYVRFGATAPTAAQFDPTDVSQRTVPWLIHEGFVIGQVSDFEPGLAECEQVP